MSETVLVVVAHPDDECFMGGTIVRLVDKGHSVHVLAFTDGVGAREQGEHERKRRAGEFEAACEVLGATAALVSHSADYPDNRLDTVSLLDVVKEIEGVVRDDRPTVVYTHHPGDLNIDHQLIARAVITATRPYPGQVVRNVYGFEVPGSTEWAVPGALPFVPTRFVSLTQAQLDKKYEALSCYKSERREPPHPRSLGGIATLAEWRGGQCGHDYAEAFTVIREII